MSGYFQKHTAIFTILHDPIYPICKSHYPGLLAWVFNIVHNIQNISCSEDLQAFHPSRCKTLFCLFPFARPIKFQRFCILCKKLIYGFRQGTHQLIKSNWEFFSDDTGLVQLPVSITYRGSVGVCFRQSVNPPRNTLLPPQVSRPD